MSTVFKSGLNTQYCRGKIVFPNHSYKTKTYQGSLNQFMFLICQVHDWRLHIACLKGLYLSKTIFFKHVMMESCLKTKFISL